MPPLRSRKGKLVLAVLVLAGLGLGAHLTWFSARESGTTLAVRPDKPDKAVALAGHSAVHNAPNFDFYLLALTVHAAFCSDGHAG